MQVIPVMYVLFQIFKSLRNINPIPNVHIFYTTARMTDLPDWYEYNHTDRVPELLAVAQPGYGIFTVGIYPFPVCFIAYFAIALSVLEKEGKASSSSIRFRLEAGNKWI